MSDEVILSVVVPTREEAQNIRPLVERLNSSLSGVDFEILFIDDSSDDTPKVIDWLRRRFPRIRLVHREGEEQRGGRSTADLEGIRRARGSYVCFLNADLQHPPEKVSELLDTALSTGADIVYANRYMAGGGTEGLTKWHRKLISLAYNFLTRMVFVERVRGISDPGSGFFLFRKSITDRVNLKPVGFKMFLEILVRCRWNKAIPIPYRMSPRVFGESKATFKQGLYLFAHMVRLLKEVPEAGRFWKFAAVGASGTVVNLLAFQLLYETLGVDLQASWLGAWLIATTSNFVFNQTMVWSDRKVASGNGLAQRIVSWIVSRGFASAVNYAVFRLMLLTPAPVLLSVFTGICAGMIVNFYLAGTFVFKPSEVSS